MTENTCSLCKHDHSKPYCLEHTSPGEQRSYCGCDGERYHDVDAPYRTLWHAVERFVVISWESKCASILTVSSAGWHVYRAGETPDIGEITILIGYASDYESKLPGIGVRFLSDVLIEEESTDWPCLKRGLMLPKLLTGITPLYMWPDNSSNLVPICDWRFGSDIGQLAHTLTHEHLVAMLRGQNGLGIPAPYVTFFAAVSPYAPK